MVSKVFRVEPTSTRFRTSILHTRMESVLFNVINRIAFSEIVFHA